MNTGKEYEYNNLDEAIKSLNESRKYNEDATWKLFAEIDA
jgi:predicted negative regulator of RcsB-dependent stress response